MCVASEMNNDRGRPVVGQYVNKGQIKLLATEYPKTTFENKKITKIKF